MNIIKENSSRMSSNKLGNLVTKVSGGKRLPKEHSLVHYDTGYPYLRVVDINEDRIKKNNLLFLLPKTQKMIERYIVNTSDVIVSNVGSVGKVVYIDKSLNGANLTENCLKILSNNKKILPKYLRFFLKTRYGQKEIKANTKKTTLDKLSLDGMKNVNVRYHTSTESQEKIANFLSERESYLQSIQSLISKMEQRNQYYLHGLTSGTLSLKEGSPVDNNEDTKIVSFYNKKKEIPASFNEFKIGDIIQEVGKSKISVKDSIKGKYPFFNCSEFLTMSHNEYLVDGNHIIMSTGGKPSVHYYSGKMAYSSDSYVFSSKKEIDAQYLSFLLKSNINRIDRCFLGSGLKHLNKNIFKKESYYLPNAMTQKEIALFLDKNEDEVKLVKELYSKEKQVFQWLCEKLVSGEYRIED